jgi:hypothetical protein
LGQLEGGLGQLGGGLGRLEAMLKNGGLEELTLPGSMFYRKVWVPTLVHWYKQLGTIRNLC